MAWNVLWKPYSDGGLNPGGLSFLLPRGGNYSGVQIIGADGQVLDTLKHSQHGNEHGEKFYTSKPGSAYGSGIKVRVMTPNGPKEFNIGNGGMRYEGTFEGDGELAEMAPGAGSAGGMGGMPGSMMPGNIGYGYYPGYQPFPSPFMTSFNSINPANYKPTDPIKFAKKFGEFNRGEIQQNYGLSKDMAMDMLDTELAGMGKYVPQMTALKMQANAQLSNQWRDQTRQNEGLRSEIIDQLTDKRLRDVGRLHDERMSQIGELSDLRRTEIGENENLRRTEIGKNVDLARSMIDDDNRINQEQRTKQLDSTIPNLRGDLREQGGRANIYARGRAPDEITDRAMELNTRSFSADRSAAGGFGAASSVARKASDLMSADRRLQLAQFGEQLLGSNLNQRAQLELAPTEYLNSAQQVKVEPGWSTDAGFSPDARFSGDVTYGGDAGFSTASGISQESGLSLAPSQSIMGTVSNNLGNFNNATMLSPGEALNTTVQQAQFKTNLVQDTNKFNAQGEFAESQANAGAQNQFALGKHAYDVGYAGTVAGAAQTNANTELGLQQQAQAGQVAQGTMQQAQQAGTAGSIGQAIGAGAAIIGGAAGMMGGGQQPVYTPPPPSMGGAPSGGGSVMVPETGATYPGGDAVGGGPGSIMVPPGESMPPGFSGVMTAPDGSTVGIPTGGGGYVTQAPSGGGGGGYSGGGSDSGQSSYTGDGGQVGSEAELADYNNDAAIASGEDIGDFSTMSARSIRSASFKGGDTGPRSAQNVNFTKDTGLKLPSDTSPVTAAITNKSEGMLNAAGVYKDARPNTQPIGVTSDGKNIHADLAWINNTDNNAGSKMVQGLEQYLNNMDVFSDPADAEKYKQFTDQNNIELHNTLDQKYSSGDTEGFVNEVLKTYGQPPIEELKKQGGDLDVSNIKDPQARQTAYNAWQLSKNWDRLSPGQKSMALAATGLQAYKFKSGEDLNSKFVVPPNRKGDPYMTVGDSLRLAQKGINAPALSKRWGQINTLQKMAGGATNVDQVAHLAETYGMLGHGPEGAAVPIQEEELKAKGFRTAPHAGVGAIRGGQMRDVPKGYRVVSQHKDGTVTAIPEANVGSAAVSKRGGSLDDTAVGKDGVPDGVGRVKRNWAKNGTPQGRKGAVGGSALAGGMDRISKENPYLHSSNVAAASLSGQIRGRALQSKAPKSAPVQTPARQAPQQQGQAQKQEPSTLQTAAQGTRLAASAANLGENWDRYDTGRKILELSRLGKGGYEFATGDKLGNKYIIEPGDSGRGLTVNGAMGLLAAGYNLSELAENWDKLNDLGKAVHGITNINTLAQLGAQAGLWGGAAQAGAGAAAGAAGGAAAAGGSAASSTGSTLGAVGTGVAIAGGIYQGAQILNSDASGEDKSKAISRTIEDTAANYYTFGMWGAAQWADRKWLGGQTDKWRDSYDKSGVGWVTNPFWTAATWAGGKLLSGGKGEAQMGRDHIRAGFLKAGGLDKDYNVTLASGQLANVGVDGRGDMRTVSNPDKLTAEDKNLKKLHTYDVDYTNDLDYASGMMGIALSRIVTGGKSIPIDQFGGQLGNAALKDVGYGQAMSPDNFQKVVANQRAIYAQQGIKSKADAYMLANQAFAEERIDEAELAAAHQAFNMVFDDGSYDTAQKLMAGRWAGVETVSSEAHGETFDDMKETPDLPAGIPQMPPGTNIDPGFNASPEDMMNITGGAPANTLAESPGNRLPSREQMEQAGQSGLFEGRRRPDRSTGNARSLKELGSRLRETETQVPA